MIELAGPLDASQESGPTSDSTATGEGLDTLTINEHGAVGCCPSLSVVGLKEADLQSPVRGPVSAIHLHKAPAGQNSLIVQDTLVDAGSMLDPLRPASMSSARVVTRWPNSDRRTSPLDRMKRSVPSSYSNLRTWVGEGRLRDVALFGGTAETAQFRDRAHIYEVSQVRVDGPPRMSAQRHADQRAR